ncbi:2-amino-3,7-dideoxy-D-threo-hept-6-ulosonate synthase [Candidatus Bathyarchaeota archaeon]|nr:2-amino-3,7-dideoxy-D-threo-hept-6-ulosonate synthase [Candidatus Bathyarchaeota archaeon]MBS7617735.1 2-amino-3,7-dideoxy-D-threo-hept-6-ulosonate synthase [Candidatus Bathyarchaeota archaeon]
MNGKIRRLSRIFRNDGKTVIIPMDHGVTLGPIAGIENISKIVEKLKRGGADAVLVHKGWARLIDTRGMSLILHISASTKLGPDPDWKVTVTSVEEAVALGADGVSIHVNIGCEREPEMLGLLGVVAESCEDWGMPLLVMAYPRGPKIANQHDPELVSHAARVAAELGADVVKTNYTGSVESFKRVVESCPIPVVIAGGPKVSSDREMLEMVKKSVDSGGAGVSIGRNVFQHEKPDLMTRAIVSIVHDGMDVEDAMEILRGG